MNNWLKALKVLRTHKMHIVMHANASRACISANTDQLLCSCTKCMIFEIMKWGWGTQVGCWISRFINYLSRVLDYTLTCFSFATISSSMTSSPHVAHLLTDLSPSNFNYRRSTTKYYESNLIKVTTKSIRKIGRRVSWQRLGVDFFARFKFSRKNMITKRKTFL